MALHCNALHCMALHCHAWHCNALHGIAMGGQGPGLDGLGLPLWYVTPSGSPMVIPAQMNYNAAGSTGHADRMPEISLPGADDGGLRLHPSAGRGLRFGPPQDRHLLHHPGSLCVLPGPISGPSLGLDSVGGSGRGGRRAFLSEPSAAERPALRRPFVYVRKDMFKMEWDGRTLTVTFPVTPRDPEAVVLSFRPHHGYARLLDAWKAGKATMGEPTLTPNSIRPSLIYRRRSSG